MTIAPSTTLTDLRWYLTELGRQSAKTEHFADLSIDQRIEVVIESMNDHPFLQEEPEQARQIAIFRVRLLNLDQSNHSS